MLVRICLIPSTPPPPRPRHNPACTYARCPLVLSAQAARNLEKLTLFRQFYVMVVVYIYFTRIVVYLLKSTMQVRAGRRHSAGWVWDPACLREQ